MNREDGREVPCCWRKRSLQEGEEEGHRGQNKGELLSEFLRSPWPCVGGLGTMRMVRRQASHPQEPSVWDGSSLQQHKTLLPGSHWPQNSLNGNPSPPNFHYDQDFGPGLWGKRSSGLFRALVCMFPLSCQYPSTSSRLLLQIWVWKLQLCIVKSLIQWLVPWAMMMMLLEKKDKHLDAQCVPNVSST